mgnify:CR=1 FL=1
MKKIIFIFIVLFGVEVSAQCAMCKAVVEKGNQEMAEGINSGITYLMIFPYLLVGILAYYFYRHRQKVKN